MTDVIDGGFWLTDERRLSVASRLHALIHEILDDLIEDIDELLAEDEEQPSQAVLDILGARPHFKVGDHVRIRINCECDYCVDPRFPKCVSDSLANDGRTARVTIVDPREPHDPDGCWCNYYYADDVSDDSRWAYQRHMHRYWVFYDEVMPHDDPRVEGVDIDAHWAATELELIDD